MQNNKRQFIVNSSKVLLFLGAGASAPFGRQTFVTFKTLFTEDNLGRDIKSFLDKIILSMELVGQRVDIEGILWKLDNYLDAERLMLSDNLFSEYFYSQTIQISRLNSFYEKIRSTKAAIEKLKTFHYGYSEERKRNSIKEKLIDQYDFYKEIATTFNGGDLHIVTTNYDMALEEIFIEKGPKDPEISLATGIEGDFLSKGFGTWNPSMYDVIPDGGKSIWYIYRLHGCTQWFFGKESIYYSKMQPDNPFDRPCIMDPGSRFNPGDEPFRTAFNKFQILLKECNLCIFVGFSFHDKDVLELLLLCQHDKGKAIIYLSY